MNVYQKKKAEEKSREDTPLVEAAMRCQAGPFHDSEMRDLLGAGGALAKSLPGYQERSSQIALAQAIYRGLKERKHVVAEAGTGTGKSLASLVPAVKHAKDSGGAEHNRRIIVSTAMLILQDQYSKKDLPFLQEHLGIDFRWCVRKGRSNYACLHRYQKVDDGEAEVPRGEEYLLRYVDDWLPRTDIGDLAELPFDASKHPKFRMAVTANANNCRGKNCAFREECFYYLSKDKAQTCEIIVCNHALLVLNEMCDGKILPEADAIIIDEAHKLEDIVRSNLAAAVTPRSFEKLLKAASELNLFPESKIEAWREKTIELLGVVDSELDQVCSSYGKWRFEPESRSEKFHDALSEMQQMLRVLYVSAREEATKEEGMPLDESQARQLMLSCEEFGSGLTSFLDPHANGCIWAERKKGKEDKPDRLSMHVAPIRVGAWMRATLLKKTCVFMSATLATSTGAAAFDSFKERLGIDQSIDVQVTSPFDYHRQMRYLLGWYPGGLDKPPSDQEEWASLIRPRVDALCRIAGGGVLFLSTSWKVCDDVFWYLSEKNEEEEGEMWTLLRQGDMSKADTIDTFRKHQNSVLCATGSFFEGVDLPGSCLRCVIIDKIPFPIRTDPIQSAIADYYGKAAFQKHLLPFAIMHLKQGVGRLIRAITDRGAAVLLDPRFRSKGYGGQILRTLPGYSEPSDIEEFTNLMKEINSAEKAAKKTA